MGRRENTFRIDFSNAPKVPSYEDIHNFIGQQLGLTRENVLQLQPNRRLGCVYVKVTDLEIAERIIEEHDNKHEIVVEGKPYKVRIEMEDGAVEVRLFDLTEFVSNEDIAIFLQSYGQVLSVRDVLWDEKFLLGGVSTGVRAARMIVDVNIPSFVVIGGQTTTLSYKGQRQTCSHCNEFAHNGIPCVQNKRLLVQKLTADQNKPSYANVAKLPTQPTLPRRLPPQRPTPTSQPTPTTANPSAPTPASQPTPTPVSQLGASTTIQVGDVQVSSMPPPAIPHPPQEITQHDPAKASTTEGSESDASQASKNLRSSKRQKNPPSKKMKHTGGYSDISVDEEA